MAMVVGILAILALLVVAVMAWRIFGDLLERTTAKAPDLLCRSCKSKSVHPSSRQGTVDSFFALFGCEPYRCDVCTWRFYVRRTGTTAGAGSR
jgi:hypothetical protein